MSAGRFQKHATRWILCACVVVCQSAGLAGKAQAQESDEDRDFRNSSITAPSPAEYLRSLELTGMQAHLQSRATAKPASTTGVGIWSSVGPVGDPIATPEMPAPGSENNGRIRSIQVRQNGTGYEVYVGASGGGLWRAYSNTGPVWTSLGDNLPNPSVGAFVVNPNDDTDILVGTGDYARGPRMYGAGLYHTTDRGGTWSFMPTSGLPQFYFRILYDPNNPNVIMAASSGALYRSEHGSGGPFDLVLGGKVTDLVMHPSLAGVQYCVRSDGDSSGVYKSVDDGRTWNILTVGYAPMSNSGNAGIAICRSQPQNLLYAYEVSRNIAGLFKSTDGGTTWNSLLSSSMPGGGQADHALTLAFDPRNPEHVFVGSNQLAESAAGGIPFTWVDQTGIATHQDQTQLYFSTLTGDNQMWVCNDGGIHLMDIDAHAATSWNGNSITGLRVSTIDYMDATRSLITIGRQDDGSLSSDDGGASWRVHICCDGLGTAISDDLNETYWYSMNQAVHMQPFSGAPVPVVNDSAVSQVVYNRFTGEIFSLFDDKSQTRVLHRPVDGSGIWLQDFGFVPPGLGGLSENRIDGRTLYAWGGTTFAAVQHPGLVWTPVQTATLPNNVICVYASTEHPLELWAGLSGGTNTAKLMHTTDGGASWTEVDGAQHPTTSLTSVGTVNAIAVVPFRPSEIYAGTNVGIFRSTDGGATWAPFQDGMPIVTVTSLRYLVDRTQGGNDVLVAATYGHGVYERTISETPLVYVDPRTSPFMYQDGSFDHGFQFFTSGLSTVPLGGGRLALYGNGGTYVVPAMLTQPVILDTYSGPATLVPGGASPARTLMAKPVIASGDRGSLRMRSRPSLP